MTTEQRLTQIRDRRIAAMANQARFTTTATQEYIDDTALLLAELDAARAREQQLEASLHSLCCAVCREPGAKGWCQSCFDRACKEVDQARGAWAREAKLREALKAVVNGNDIAAERNHSIEAWPGSPIRRQACAALAEGEDTRG